MASFTEQYQNTSRERRQTLLRCLANSVMKADTDPDVFMSETYQLRYDFSDLDELVTTERLTIIIIGA